MENLITTTMTCPKCQTEWALDEFEGMTLYEQDQFKNGVGCPECVRHVQVVVCRPGAGEEGTWFRMQVTIDMDVPGALLDSEAEQAALAILEQMGEEDITAVFAEGIIGDCYG